jgi:predicted outer membrane protein
MMTKRAGRPRKGESKVPYDEIDNLLVHGEMVTDEDGNSTRVFPTYRQIAERFGVANSLVARYAKQHDCVHRRTGKRLQLAIKTDQMLMELRAKTRAYSADDALHLLDAYLAGFEKAVAEGRVRFDNPSDLNTILRLKTFLEGGADSRQEIHVGLSLEDLQQHHRRALELQRGTTAAERGEVIRDAPRALPPPGEPSTADLQGIEQPSLAHFPAHFPVAAHGPVSAPPGNEWEEGSDGGDDAPQGANVAPTARPGDEPGEVSGAIGHDGDDSEAEG